MTEKLYYNDSFKLNFESQIIKTSNDNGKFHIVMDKTYFYPTSGGQSFDTGIINEIPVIDVFEKDGEIIHVLEKELSLGKAVSKINYERRLQNIQHHTGQHLLSQAFIKVLNAPTISIHLGEDICNIEIVKSDLTSDDAFKVEEFANDLIYQNKSLSVYYVDKENISDINLRKPPKKSGQGGIRIVEIEDFDISACGGTHATTTGQIGMIKIIGWEKYKGNIKVDFICGLRALRDYRFKNTAIKNISTKFSTKDKQIEEIINKSINDSKDNLKELSIIKKELAFYKSKELIDNAEEYKSFNLIAKSVDTSDLFFLKNIAQEIIKDQNNIAILYTNIDSKFNCIICCSENIKINLNKYLLELLKHTNGKGGGKPNFVQGSCTIPENLNNIIDSVIELIKKELV